MTTIINFKGSETLKEAIRIVAFHEREKLPRSGSSALILSILESDPRVAKELKKLASGNKKKVSNN